MNKNPTGRRSNETQSKAKGDTYARGTMNYMSLPVVSDIKTITSPIKLQPGKRLEDLKGESGIPFMKGETENHKGQRITYMYLYDPKNIKVRELALYWFRDRIKLVGLEGKELLFSSSHWGHFGACYGPMLFQAMRAGDSEMVEVMKDLWRMLYCAAMVLSYRDKNGELRIVSPCARCHLEPKEKADQRVEVNLTFTYLKNGKLKRIPQWVSRDAKTTVPSVLGLTSLFMIEDAYRRGEEWAGEWEEIKGYIRVEERDEEVEKEAEEKKLDRYLPYLPPLVKELIVIKDKREDKDGYFAFLGDTEGLRHPAPWVYITGKEEIYGYPLSDKMISLGEELKESKTGEGGRIIRFPVAGKEK